LVKEIENSIRTGYRDGHWYSYPSLEGGTKTIAYGHKLKEKENFSKGLTENEAVELLRKDLQTSLAKVERVWYGRELSTEYLRLLTVLEFNTGTVSPNRWPKLATALSIGCEDSIRGEIVTGYRTKKGVIKLQQRANTIANKIL